MQNASRNLVSHLEGMYMQDTVNGDVSEVRLIIKSYDKTYCTFFHTLMTKTVTNKRTNDATSLLIITILISSAWKLLSKQQFSGFIFTFLFILLYYYLSLYFIYFLFCFVFLESAVFLSPLFSYLYTTFLLCCLRIGSSIFLFKLLICDALSQPPTRIAGEQNRLGAILFLYSTNKHSFQL